MRILTVCAEFAPLAKVGGLGDVTAGLTSHLTRRGHDVAVVMPSYGVMDAQARDPAPVLGPRRFRAGTREVSYAVHRALLPESGAAIYLVDCPALFGRDVYEAGELEARRFMLLSHAALQTAAALGLSPDVVHCHDWHAAPAIVMLKGPYAGERAFRQAYAVLTIHNIGYQGIFDATVLTGDDPRLRPLLAPVGTTAGTAGGEVNFLRAGIACADALTTVSPTHAREIQTPEYGMGLDELLRQRRHRLAGILNGVDYELWSPETDRMLPAHYSAADTSGKRVVRAELLRELSLDAAPETPIVGLVSRLAEQKGIDLIVDALPALLSERAFVCAFLGNGEPLYAEALRKLAVGYPGRVVHVDGYDERLAHLILAGSDVVLLPSRYEPCGLTQMYAMRYGTVPVVRRTGGLADTVEHFDPATGQGTGSVFRDADVGGLTWGLATALNWFRDPRAWAQLMRNGMARDFSWERQGPKYEALFARLVNGG